MLLLHAMNYLAHLYLSPGDDLARIGCFIADAVKGSQMNSYPQRIREGILLHRAIDSFTDQHPIVKECILKLRPKFRLFSAVVIDIYFDHFLAANWNLYSSEPLSGFAERQYNIIQDHLSLLPPKIQQAFFFIKSQNWLENYKDLDFLKKVFNGMSQRTSYFSNMETAVEELKAEYSFFEDRFFLFFPLVCKQFSIVRA